MDFDRIKQALKLNKWPVISLKEQLKEEQKKRIERILSILYSARIRHPQGGRWVR